MTAFFDLVPAVVQSFATGTLSAADLPGPIYSVCRSEPGFPVRSVDWNRGKSSAVEVGAEITNSSGAVVSHLIGNLAQTVSRASVILTPGRSAFSISVINTTGAQVPAIAYLLSGGRSFRPDRASGF